MAAPSRVSTDDPVFRIRQVWLGPTGWSFPFQARYLAWALWFVLFVGLWIGMALLGILGGIIPVWPMSLSVVLTYALMSTVDHEVTLRALIRTVRAEFASRHQRQPKPLAHRYTNTRVDHR